MPDVIERATYGRGARVALGIAVLIITQVLAAEAGITFAGVNGRVSLIWPPAGVALAALLLFGLRLWPGVAAGAFAAALLTGATPIAALINALGSTLAACGATVVLRRVGFRAALDGVSDLVAFVLVGAVGASVVSAVLGTSGLLVAGRIPAAAWTAVAWRWWLGDASGVLVIASAILATAGAVRGSRLRATRLLEATALVVAILVLGSLVLAAPADTAPRHDPLVYLFFPFLISAAFRFGPAGAALAALLIAALSTFATAHGQGPFALAAGEGELALLSLFIAVTSVTGLFVAAVIAERERAESERVRLAAVIQATSDFVAITDAHGRIMFLNGAGRTLLGYGPDEDLALLTEHDFHPPAAAVRLSEIALPAAVRSGIWSGESTFRDRNGRDIPVSEVIVAHRDATGAVQFLSTVARDLRERVDLERQLISAQKMEAVGRLAGGIAHDFNNLLTVITGQARLATDALPDGHPARPGVEEIGEAAERAATLTRQLLAFARRQRVEPRNIDLNELVRGMDRMLRRLIGADVALVTICEPALPPVRVDPGQFEQLIVNLAVNARDAMPAGGSLTIETSTADTGSSVRLAVTDTGIGMDAGTLAHIFEPFFTTKSQDKGTGLGLATCYGIVTQAGGSISVQSQPGHGARFTVELPAAHGQVEEAEAQAEASPAGRGTILLVEDEPGVRNLARRVLEGHGYIVHVAADGQEALEQMPRIGGQLDLIITDMVMPRMGGLRMIERMRAQGRAPKVLFISGYAGDAELDEGEPFLPKPFTPAQLAGRVHALLHD